MLSMFLKQKLEIDDASYTLAVEPLEKMIVHIEQGNDQRYVDEQKRIKTLQWCRGFRYTLRELHESLLCCRHFANQVNCTLPENSDLADSLDYARFVYFYKNSLIRIFSLLDKLGYFMNDYFQLRTEIIKSRFSYFTVLRRFDDFTSNLTIKQALLHVKSTYQAPLYRLREQRNLEIHYINIELVEQLMKQDIRYCNRFETTLLNPHLDDLQHGFEMVCKTIQVLFNYAIHPNASRVGEPEQ